MIFANINGFWDPMMELLRHMTDEGFIRPQGATARHRQYRRDHSRDHGAGGGSRERSRRRGSRYFEDVTSVLEAYLQLPRASTRCRAKPCQIGGKAIIRACRAAPSIQKTAIRKIIVGAILHDADGRQLQELGAVGIDHRDGGDQAATEQQRGIGPAGAIEMAGAGAQFR